MKTNRRGINFLVYSTSFGHEIYESYLTRTCFHRRNERADQVLVTSQRYETNQIDVTRSNQVAIN